MANQARDINEIEHLTLTNCNEFINMPFTDSSNF